MSDSDKTATTPGPTGANETGLAGQGRAEQVPAKPAAPVLPKEVGGPAGPEPTRYGDWAHKGRVTDF